jgi:hypothetical protein
MDLTERCVPISKRGNAMIDSLMESMVCSGSGRKGARSTALTVWPRTSSKILGSPGRGPAGFHGRWLPLWRHRSRLPRVARNAMVDISCWGRRGGGNRTGSWDRLRT